MALTTKRALAASFRKLLASRPLDKITVKDIVEEAEVNRQTFYYHFRDIYDLIRWILDEEAQVVFNQENDPNDWRSNLRCALNAMIKERALIMNAFHSLSREHLEQYLNNVIYTLVCDKMEEFSDGLNISDDDKRFIADFYKHAFVGILLDWINKGMRDDPTALVDKLLRMLEGELRHSLEMFSA